MAFNCGEFGTRYVKWTVPLPHPDSSCKSSEFSLDGSQWYLELNGLLKMISSRPDRYVEGWTINLLPCVTETTRAETHVVLYVEKSLVYERVAEGIDSLRFDRRSLAKDDDTVNMLFLFAPRTVCASKEILRQLESGMNLYN